MIIPLLPGGHRRKGIKNVMKPPQVAFIIGLLTLMLFGFWLCSRGQGPPPYRVLDIPDLLTDALVAAALERGLKPSEVLDATGTRTLDLTHRTSDQTWYRDNEHPVAAGTSCGDGQQTGRHTQEQLQVVRYPTGGHFRDHHDAFFHKTMHPRRATLLVHLNDDFDGGDTAPKLFIF